MLKIVDNELILENIVVDVAFILLIDVVWPLTYPNIVVDVAFKLLILSVELFHNQFKLLNIVVYNINSLSNNSTLSINNLNATSTTILGLVNY